MFQYEITERGVRITEYCGGDVRVEVPEEIGGLPVREIGAYAFSGKEITHLKLPESIERIGRYAFYLCSSLRLISFFSSIRDLGAGALSGCHRVETLRVTIVPGAPSCLRDFLSEISEAVCVEYCDGVEFARLMFPEFYEEGVENTPARIIESHMHGSGIQYRNSFLHREFQFQEYDDKFSLAKSQESREFCLELALGRLQYPYRLSKSAREAYLDYIKRISDWAADYLTRRGEAQRVSFLMELTRERGRASAPSFEI